MASATLTQVASTLAETAHRRYRDVIRQYATGRDVDDLVALQIAAAAGKNASDLDQAISRLKARIEAADDIAAADAEKPLIAELQSKMAQEIDALDLLEKECEAKLGAAHAKLSNASAQYTAARNEASTLRSGAIQQLAVTADPVIEAEIHRLEGEISGHTRAINGRHEEGQTGRGASDAKHQASIDQCNQQIAVLRKKKLDPTAGMAY